jgi:hypothetical protein
MANTSDKVWRDILDARLGDRQLAADAVVLLAAPGSDSLQLRFQKLCAQHPDVSKEDLTQLYLIVELCDIDDGDLTIPARILLTAWDPPLTTINDVARFHFQLEPWPEAPDQIAIRDQLENHRKHLYRLCSTAVICGAVENGHLVVSPDTMVQDEARHFFKTAVEDGFDLSRQNIGSFLQGYFSTRVLPPNCPLDTVRIISRFAMSVQRLRPLVYRPQDIQIMLNAGFTSAHDICSNVSALDLLKQHQMDNSIASSVIATATRIETRNSQAWLAFVKARQNVPVLSISQDGLNNKIALWRSASRTCSEKLTMLSSMIGPRLQAPRPISLSF